MWNLVSSFHTSIQSDLWFPLLFVTIHERMFPFSNEKQVMFVVITSVLIRGGDNSLKDVNQKWIINWWKAYQSDRLNVDDWKAGVPKSDNNWTGRVILITSQVMFTFDLLSLPVSLFQPFFNDTSTSCWEFNRKLLIRSPVSHKCSFFFHHHNRNC
jgi:hypothetical protein